MESSKYIMLSYSGLCQRRRIPIVIKQLVTVHCSFLYLELEPLLSTKAYSNVEFCVTKEQRHDSC